MMSGLTGLPGTRLGEYELIEPIGSGGMAEVYRAKQCTAFGREVALKVIRPEFTGDEQFRQRFLREAQVIARLSHPHILPLIEFGHEQRTLYLVMPLVREGTLRDLLKAHQAPLSLEEVLPLFVPLCDAVEYAHQEGILHRDIKPQNILLQLHTHVLLADFGIARDRFDTNMPKTGGVIGSVEYMAPEQAEGQEDARSDIYSLGVVLYQLLTGTVPYADSMPHQVLFKKAHDPLPDPRIHNPTLPSELADILQIALAKDPQRRFDSAGALGDAVEQIMPHAVPPPIQYQMPWWHNPYAPASHDVTSAPTRMRSDQPSGGALAASDGQHLDNAPTTPVPASSAPTFLYISQPSPSSLDGSAPSDWATRSTLHDESWQNAPAWGNQRSNAQPGASRKPQRARLLPLLLVSSMAAVLLLTLCVSSVAAGRVGLSWLRAGSASTGAQFLTPTSGVATQPTQPSGPVSTAPSWPPPGNAQPTSPAAPPSTSTSTTQPTAPSTPQATGTAHPQPSPTATPLPTDTPTPQPTATSVPVPTDTPAPQPTDAPQPRNVRNVHPER